MKDPCLPPEVSQEIFKKFGLVHCRLARYEAKNWDEFHEKMAEIYDQVESSSIEEDGEGAVMYFVAQYQDVFIYLFLFLIFD